MNTASNSPGAGLGNQGPRVGSINCNGMRNRLKRDSVLHWLQAKPDDILFLQETHSTPDVENEWRRSWEGHIYFNHGASNSTGVCILVKRRATHVKVCKHVIVEPGRVHYLEIEIDQINYCLVNMYAPNNDDLPLFERVFLDVLGRPRNDFLIMSGALVNIVGTRNQIGDDQLKFF